jgi:hypothetical protein
MSARLLTDPLGIACVFSDGSRVRRMWGEVADSQLACDLLTGLTHLVHPHGTVDAEGTLGGYLTAARNLVDALGRRGFHGGAAQLTRGMLIEYWMSVAFNYEASTRRMLRAFDTATGGLDIRVRELTAGNAYHRQPRFQPLGPYREAEWVRLTNTCRTIVDDAYAAHRRALGDAERGSDPREAGWTRQNVTWLLARIGPASAERVAAHLSWSRADVEKRGGVLPVRARLFPNLDVTVAYLLLFGIYSGIVPDGIAGLGLRDLDWAGDATILLSYVKRRTGPESVTLPKNGVRLLEQWLSHSAMLRSFAAPDQREQLWLWVNRQGGARVYAGAVDVNAVRAWGQRHDIRSDTEGADLLRIHRHRIRTTHQALRDKDSWRGSPRALIDPNHSPAVEGDHYLTATTPAQMEAVEAIAAEAQHDLVRRAQPPTVLTDTATAQLAGDYPELVAALKVDNQVIAELLGGQRDVFTAACGDQLSGLHGPKGKPCPARPWVCLLCPLAVFAPRHAPNLLRLKAFFSRQWQNMPATHFMATFGAYAQRLDDVLARYDPAIVAAASRHVAGTDDEIPLRPEESTR